MIRKSLEETYGFNANEIAQLQYLFKSILSELSKFVILSLLFRREFSIYVFAVCLCSLLRITSGGFHCRHYISCLFASIFFFFLAVKILPVIMLPVYCRVVCIFVCSMLCLACGPVRSSFRERLPRISLYVSKVILAGTMIGIIITTCIIPDSAISIIGNWIIILHTLQLVAAKVGKEAKKHEEENND